MPIGLLVAILALPASAGIVLPHDPLTTATRVAPNILFILDDSGSMNFVAMPGDVAYDNSSNYGSGVQYGLRDNPTDRSYVNNAVYYNPNVIYRPWKNASGNRVSGGEDVGSVFSSLTHLSGSRNLKGSNESIFYVPKDGVVASTDPDDFVKYWVRDNNGTAEVVRASEQDVVLQSWSFTQNIGENSWAHQTIAVPSGTARLEIRIYGNTNNRGNADLYLRRSANPTTGDYDQRARGSGSSHELIQTNPESGNWRVGVYNSDSGSGDRSVYGNVLSITAYRNVEVATPTGREQADELTNIARWYSYHRTRMKSAKAGASEAFGELDSKVRVGFRTINQAGASGNRLTHARPIPVGANDGRFSDGEDCSSCDNRSEWYSRLHSAAASGGTPLVTALNDAGTYFSSSSAAGPYGPEATQYSCRQNFSILTTDGFWNSDSISGIGNADGTNGSTITGTNNQSYRYLAAADENSKFGDDYSNTLADVAMYYWKRDLRAGTGGLANNVPTTSANPAFWQHMVTFGISIGLNTTTGWSSVADVPNNPTWPDPQVDETGNVTIPERMDDLLHAAVNSRGAFVAATDPQMFTAGLSEALAAIQERTSSYSNVATNSVSLDTDTKVFSASYVSGVWTGAVTAREVTGDGVSESIAWSATIPTWNTRKIFTSGSSGGAVFPTSSQRDALARTSGGPANYEVTGGDNANYIKGERRLEANRSGNLRNRNSVLGDIVNSSPAYVKVGNVETLYVGANDGMLHAFDANSGQELFAYVPNIVSWDDLATLSKGDYDHRYFVDGPIAVSARSLTSGQNILVGTLGRGGTGLYALDVTNPTTFGPSNVLWERAETDQGNFMGLVMGKPLLAKASNGTNAVVLGNGINSVSERAALVVLDIQSGEVIRTIDTGAGSVTAPNGLSEPIGVYGLDGKTIQYAYAGDMLGNVWKFDLRSSNPAAWTSARLFTAIGPDGVAQPITGGLATKIHPVTRKRWIFFGTGRYLTTGDADATNDTYQSMYAITEDGNPPLARSDLTVRGFTTTSATVDGYEVRTFQAPASLPQGSKGWYIDLPNGERIVQSAQTVSNVLITSSIVPSGSACEADGSGFLNAIDAFTGTSTGISYFDLDGEGSSNDVVSGVPIGSINLGIGMPTQANLLRGMIIVGGTGAANVAAGAGSLISTRPIAERVSWREVRGD